MLSQTELRHFGGAFGGRCYSCVSRRGSQSSENSLTHINVANGHCPLQLEFYFQLPTLVLRTAEPRSPLTVWVQQVLHRILGILSQREKENIRTLTEPKAKEDAHEGGIPASPNLSRHFNMIERVLDGSYHAPGDLQTFYLSFIYLILLTLEFSV